MRYLLWSVMEEILERQSLKNIQPQALLFGDACLSIHPNMKIGMLNQKLKRRSQEVGALWKSLAMLVPSRHHGDSTGKLLRKFGHCHQLTSMTYMILSYIKCCATFFLLGFFRVGRGVYFDKFFRLMFRYIWTLTGLSSLSFLSVFVKRGVQKMSILEWYDWSRKLVSFKSYQLF